MCNSVPAYRVGEAAPEGVSVERVALPDGVVVACHDDAELDRVGLAGFERFVPIDEWASACVYELAAKAIARTREMLRERSRA